METSAPARIRLRPSGEMQSEPDAEAGQNEGEFADLGEARADGERCVQRITQREGEGDRGQRLADHHNADDREHAPGLLDEGARIQGHAHRDEEQNGKGVAQRQGFIGGAMAEFRLAHHHAGEEGAEREGDVEELGRAIGDAERGGDDAEREQFARADARHPEQNAREQPPSDHQHENDEGRHFGERHADDRPYIDRAGVGVRIAASEQPRRRGQQDQQKNGRQILDDEPADGDAAVDRLHFAALLQRAQQHHSAGAGEREAEDQRRAEMPAPIGGDANAERRGDGHLHNGSRRGDAADG